MDTNVNPQKVFYSYSHEDEQLRRRLGQHLSMARRAGLIVDWHDHKISPGSEWEEKVSEKLEEANIILLLVSASFLDSDYCWSLEMQKAMKKHHDAMKKHHDGSARVLPILLRPVDWEGAPFAKLQFLPRDGRPVTRWQDRHRAFVNIARAIRQVCHELYQEELLRLKERRREEILLMPSLERSVEEFIEENPQDPDVHLLRALENGRWQRSEARAVALRIKELMINFGKWRPKYGGKNVAKMKKHERTKKVLRYIEAPR